MKVFKRFLPDIYSKDIFSINYKKLKENDIKCLLFDVDNTITPAKKEEFFNEIKKLFDELKKDFKVILFSNNFPKRIRRFGEYYNVDIEYLSVKPFQFKYRKILKKYGYKKKEVACIGDQLITDIQGGNNAGITTVLINPMSSEDEKETWFNRQLEKMIFNNFKKNKLLIKGKYYE